MAYSSSPSSLGPWTLFSIAISGMDLRSRSFPVQSPPVSARVKPVVWGVTLGPLHSPLPLTCAAMSLLVSPWLQHTSLLTIRCVVELLTFGLLLCASNLPSPAQPSPLHIGTVSGPAWPLVGTTVGAAYKQPTVNELPLVVLLSNWSAQWGPSPKELTVNKPRLVGHSANSWWEWWLSGGE